MNSYRELLAAELERRKTKNNRYTLRSFARDLGVGPTTLSGVMTGERHLSRQNAMKVGANLKWDAATIDGMLREIGFQTPEGGTSSIFTDKRTLEMFDQICRWYYFAILRLSELPDNRAQPKWVAERLNISLPEAEEACQRLLDLGLIRIEEGCYRRTQLLLPIVADPPTETMKGYQAEVLTMARHAVLETDPEKRLSLVSTIAVDPAFMKRCRKLIWAFSRRLGTKLRGRAPKEVYFLSVQVVPAKKP